MTLQVIGAGFGRTGTHSLKLALEMLGFSPCYHMAEVFPHPEHSPMWERVADGETALLDTILAGYKAGVDWPLCTFWRELSQRYPDAKVLLTERDEKAWYKSISGTIIEYMEREPSPDWPDAQKAQAKMGLKIVADMTFGRRYDEDHVIAVYRAHNAAVKRTIPPERLLVYDVPQGWEPLCRFLGVPVPASPFPKTNSTEDFRAMMLS